MDVRRARTRIRKQSLDAHQDDPEAIRGNLVPLAPLAGAAAGALGLSLLSDDGDGGGGWAETIQWLVVLLLVGGITVGGLIVLLTVV